MIELDPQKKPWVALNLIVSLQPKVFYSRFPGFRISGFTPRDRCLVLAVNQGGLQNREIHRDFKDKFKHDVTPYLAEMVGIEAQNLTGKLTIHYSKGLMKTANFSPR